MCIFWGGVASLVPAECIFCRMISDRSLVPYWIAETDRDFALLDVTRSGIDVRSWFPRCMLWTCPT